MVSHRCTRASKFHTPDPFVYPLHTPHRDAKTTDGSTVLNRRSVDLPWISLRSRASRPTSLPPDISLSTSARLPQQTNMKWVLLIEEDSYVRGCSARLWFQACLEGASASTPLPALRKKELVTPCVFSFETGSCCSRHCWVNPDCREARG